MAFKLSYGKKMNNSPIRVKGEPTFDYSKSSGDLKDKYKSKKELKGMEPFKTQIRNKNINTKQKIRTALIPIAAGFLTSKSKFVR